MHGAAAVGGEEPHTQAPDLPVASAMPLRVLRSCRSNAGCPPLAGPSWHVEDHERAVPG